MFIMATQVLHLYFWLNQNSALTNDGKRCCMKRLEWHLDIVEILRTYYIVIILQVCLRSTAGDSVRLV